MFIRTKDINKILIFLINIFDQNLKYLSNMCLPKLMLYLEQIASSRVFYAIYLYIKPLIYTNRVINQYFKREARENSIIFYGLKVRKYIVKNVSMLIIHIYYNNQYIFLDISILLPCGSYIQSIEIKYTHYISMLQSVLLKACSKL